MGVRRSGLTVSDMPGPGPIDSVGFSWLLLWAWKKRPTCQPDTRRLPLKGSWQKPLIAKRLRASNSDRPRSPRGL